MVKDNLFFNSDNWKLVKVNQLFFLQNWRMGKILIINSNVARIIKNIIDFKIVNYNKINRQLLNFLKQVSILTTDKFRFNKKLSFIEYPGLRLKRVLAHITDKCNLNCQHCYIRPNFINGNKIKNQELKLNDIITILKEMSQMGALGFSISGGEPFLYDNFTKIIDAAVKNHIFIDNIFTNGTIIDKNKKIIQKLKKEYWTTFYVSIDGIGKIHDQFRGKSGAFKRTIKGINYLYNNGFRIVFNVSLSKINYKSITDLYEFAKHYKLKCFRVCSNFYLGRWIGNSGKLSLSIKDELTTYINIFKKWIKDKQPFGLELGHVVRMVPDTDIERNYNSDSVLCQYYADSLALWPNGSISFCPLLPDYKGINNIKRLSLHEIWESKNIIKFKTTRLKEILNSECRKCSLLKDCGMGCRANAIQRGLKYCDKDPEICEQFKHPLYKKIKKLELIASKQNV